MKIGVPFFQFAIKFRSFLEDKGFDSPSRFHRDLMVEMGKDAPSQSTIWAAFYGVRTLPAEVIVFMRERYGFKISWRDLIQVRNLNGISMKTNQLSLPGMRELHK